MSTPFGHDRFRAEHERARHLAAQRLAAPLDDGEAEWLAAHLTWCAPCRAVHEEYQAQRLELRSLRLDIPPTPRDMWARTSSSIDRERPPSAVPSLGTGTAPVVRGRNQIPLGAMSGMLVVVLVVGATMLGGQSILRPQATQVPRGDGPRPAATPFAVPTREVGLYHQLADGRLALVTGRVDQVCPLDAGSGCATGRLDAGRLVDVGAARAHAVLESPTRSQLIVVGRDTASGGVDLFVVPIRAEAAPPGAPLPPDGGPSSEAPDPGGDPAAAASQVPSDPGASPEGDASPSDAVAGPSGSPAPAAGEDRETDGSTPEPPPEPSAAADASVAPASTEPTPAAPSATPFPETETVIRIASDVFVIGDVGEYLPDGSAFAFTARPADGRHGPDVYLWRPGQPEAVAVTTDHASVFADWVDGQLLISRVSGDVAADGSQQPVSVLVDPATGVQRVISVAPAWRPTVDPTARTAVWWDGSLRRSTSGSGWQGSDGRLVLGRWRGPNPADGSSPHPAVAPDILAQGSISEWQVRWDETGTRLALWIVDPDDPTQGRLSLYRIDATTGRIDRDGVLLADEPATNAFSIGGGRLAWVRPEEGGVARVAVLVWTETQVGQVDLVPGSEALALIR